MEVRDFGSGFDSSIVKKGIGLDNILHKVKEVKAGIDVQSSSRNVTSIRLVMYV